MTDYLLRRLLMMIPTLLGMTLVVFIVMAASPGGLSASSLISGQMEPEAKKALEDYYNRRYGLDDPLPLQYLRWLNNISPVGFETDPLSGESRFSFWKGADLGDSLYYGRSVADLLKERVPVTLLLNLLSVPLIYLLAIVLGVQAARKRGSLFDRISGTLLLGLWSLPTMLAGILLIGFLASEQYLHWFPVSGLSYREAVDMPFLPHWDTLVAGLLTVVLLSLSTCFALWSMLKLSANHRQAVVALSVLVFLVLFYITGHIGVTGALAILLIGALLTVQATSAASVLRASAYLIFLLTMSVLSLKFFAPGEFTRGFLLDRVWHLVLPVICLSYGGIAYLAKLTRSGVLENLRANFARTARAKGLHESEILWHHVFRNSLLPLITVAASVLPGLLAGSIIVETLFSIDGMGKLAVEAVQGRDRELVLSITLISGLLTLFSYLIADILYALVDPRVSYE